MNDKVSNEQLAGMLAGAKLDAQMQTSTRYKRQAEEQVSILTELLSLRNAQSEAVACWAVHSLTGAHVGLWEDETYARNVLKEYAGGTITSLYTHPAPQSEAVAVDGEYAWGLLRNTAEAICKKLESESASVTIFDQSALRESLDRVSALTHPAPPLDEAAWQFTLHPMDTAPSGDDALEPSEIDVHEGSWAILVGTNAKPIGWIDTHDTFKGRTYRDRILPAPPLAVTDEMVGDLDMAKDLIAEAKGLAGFGSVSDHLDAADNWLLRVRDALTAALEAKQ